MASKLITPPAVEPVTLAEAKAQCNVDGTDHDDALNFYISVAREYAENRTEKSLITQTRELALDAFPVAEIEIPMLPVQSIASVKYLDTAGVEQTIDAANYALDNYGNLRHWVIPAYGLKWPDALASTNAVRVRYVAGYGASGSDVPYPIRAWIRLAIGSLFANRESIAQGQVAELPGGFCRDLISAYCQYTF